MEVQSEVGKGTRFSVYLPETRAEAEDLSPAGGRDSVPRGNERVLVIEDEDGVRELTCRVLEMQGYEVLEAALPSDALALSSSIEGSLDLILSDVVMPEMSGPEVAELIVAQHPDAKVIFMSGHTTESVLKHGTATASLLLKPFEIQALVRTVRDALDG
jgi:DNA-binding NtrC family response regulator